MRFTLSRLRSREDRSKFLGGILAILFTSGVFLTAYAFLTSERSGVGVQLLTAVAATVVSIVPPIAEAMVRGRKQHPRRLRAVKAASSAWAHEVEFRRQGESR